MVFRQNCQAVGSNFVSRVPVSGNPSQEIIDIAEQP